MELGHRGNGSFGSSFTSGSPGHHIDPVWDLSLSGFRKNAQNAKRTFELNAEMTKVIVRCLLLDWNHLMSVHAMNFYFYLWLLQTFWPENTSSHIGLSRHLEIITEQDHRVNWVSGSLDSRVTGSLGHKMWPSSISGFMFDNSSQGLRRLTLDNTLLALIHCYVFSAAYLYKHLMIWRRYHTAEKLEGPHVGWMSIPFLSPLLALFAVSCSSAHFFHTRTFHLKFD